MEIITRKHVNPEGTLTYSESLSMRKMIWVLLPITLAIVFIPAAGLNFDQWKSQWNVNFWSMLTPYIIMIVIAILFWNIRLTWTLSASEFSFTYFPFVLKKRRYTLSEIEDIQVLKINSLLEFGGWGLRNGRLGKAYTTSGNYILHVKLKQGRPINLSVLRPQQAKDFLSQIGLSN